jgi:hypothetical protein
MWRFAAILLAFAQPAATAELSWQDVAKADIAALQDDDLNRHAADAAYLDGLTVSQTRFSEAGFDWHVLKFTNSEKPAGPLWAVPHDDENAAFEAAIAAVKFYGGTVVAVNSGPGSSRFQQGSGTCGGRPARLTRCDPNRNFSAATPLFTQAFVGQLLPGQPIIALHTNSPGHGAGKGSITILDAEAAARGVARPRKDGHFGVNQPAALSDPDSYAILPYRAPTKPAFDVECRDALVPRGVHVWHEYVGNSDGSLSNYAVLSLPGVAYVNMESRREADLSIATERHMLMIAAYFEGCARSGN